MHIPDQEYATSLTDAQRAARRLNTVLERIDRRLVYEAKDHVLAVYDMGVEIPITARCQCLEDLEQVSINAGYAAACPGYVRLGTVPVGMVTGDLVSTDEMQSEATKITGAPQELSQDGTISVQRSVLPWISIGDEVIMWLKDDTPLGGRHARMECVEMTGDMLAFREVQSQRHLTADEQKAMHEALRRSTKLVAKGRGCPPTGDRGESACRGDRVCSCPQPADPAVWCCEKRMKQFEREMGIGV